jgi:hypothetical protein
MIIYIVDKITIHETEPLMAFKILKDAEEFRDNLFDEDRQGGISLDVWFNISECELKE